MKALVAQTTQFIHSSSDVLRSVEMANRSFQAIARDDSSTDRQILDAVMYITLGLLLIRKAIRLLTYHSDTPLID